ncbi:MAG: hypothetical protein AAF664_17910 [Planctomycetota bacterium]
MFSSEPEKPPPNYPRSESESAVVGYAEVGRRGGRLHHPEIRSDRVEIIGVLGSGRAAVAREVRLRTTDHQRLHGVEKLFTPGHLTRSIYAASFASPFAYQHNRDAILTCYYRRQLAALALSLTDQPVDVALPQYVRFDAEASGWVLGAEKISGRRLDPGDPAEGRRSEIHQLVAHMRQVVGVLQGCGLVGSGWQVDPAALVSTANLLAVDDRYTIVDLESGIPAVLVPRYLFSGLRRGHVPPFDDLDEGRVRSWVESSGFEACERMRRKRPDQCHSWDAGRIADRLVRHNRRWKESELAPWRRLASFNPDGLTRYRQACRIRYQRLGWLPANHPNATAAARWTWWCTRLPSELGVSLARLGIDLGYRSKVKRLISDSTFRKKQLATWHEQRVSRLKEVGRLAAHQHPGRIAAILHAIIAKVMPAAAHRAIVDGRRRSEIIADGVLLGTDANFQRLVGQTLLLQVLARRTEAGTLNRNDSIELAAQTRSSEVTHCVQGFGAHLLAKGLSPFVAPAKYGGVAWFIVGGGWATLLPMLILPALRTVLTSIIWWRHRHQDVRLLPALLFGMIPTLGSLAFPFQLRRSQPRLSAAMLLDFATGVGARLPIYGGGDSRTQWFLIEMVQLWTSRWNSEIKHAPLMKTKNKRDVESEELLRIPRAGWRKRWVLRRADRVAAWSGKCDEADARLKKAADKDALTKVVAAKRSA